MTKKKQSIGPVTRDQVSVACNKILGDMVFDGLNRARMSLPVIMSAAVKQAFLYPATNKKELLEEEILRHGMTQLEVDGVLL